LLSEANRAKSDLSLFATRSGKGSAAEQAAEGVAFVPLRELKCDPFFPFFFFLFDVFSAI